MKDEIPFGLGRRIERAVQVFAFLVVVTVAGFARAQAPVPSASDRPIVLALPNSDVSDVLKLYAKLSGRKVWIELGLTGKVSISTAHPVSRDEALSLIRDSLREKGIEVREVGDSEAFVSRLDN
jgi:type II secretory pathway component GspD/PulD (secretin)